MTDINAKLIIGSDPDAETLVELKKNLKPGQNDLMGFTIFELECKGRIFYCSWSGGKLTAEGPLFTLIGKAAMESLKNLPMGNNDRLIIQELRMGKTPIKDKIIALLDETPENSKICFLGDMQGELDGQMAKSFTPAGMIEL
ncbi:hypothetical protein V0M98_36470 (plasmid) [Pseudomonas silesiensis]|uniref:hypothetical protein n=1 Tax=Pseudomonas silesiensis TaxID=1853130 RepID=UPI0030D0802F